MEDFPEHDSLKAQIAAFCSAHYEEQVANIANLSKMPGHAGFAYGFDVIFDGSTGKPPDEWFLRLPPPDVKLQGTADVLRQVAVLNILPDHIPHCAVRWSGDDPQWFGRPYFVVPKLQGDVVRQESHEWVAATSKETRRRMAEQAMTALANIHKLDWRDAPRLGKPIEFVDDVERWDRFVAKAADPQRLALVPEVRALLLSNLPQDAPVGIFHGDFQWSNLFYAQEGTLLAVIDWELVGVGATLNDVGWIATFNDPEAWSTQHRAESLMPQADELITLYQSAYGQPMVDTQWYRALAAYKFAIITGFNLMLHRRGKRHDPMWETSKLSIEPLLARARQLLL